MAWFQPSKASGALGETGKETNITTHQVKYADLKKKGPQSFHSKGGWAGITDKMAGGGSARPGGHDQRHL